MGGFLQSHNIMHCFKVIKFSFKSGIAPTKSQNMQFFTILPFFGAQKSVALNSKTLGHIRKSRVSNLSIRLLGYGRLNKSGMS
jgi:hypothetical protein